MRWLRPLLYLLAAAGIVFVFLSLMQTPLSKGEQAQLSTVVRSYDGKTWPLSRLAGKPMVVNFWATWCPPCIDELPVLDVLSRKYADSVHFVGLAVDSPAEDVANMVKRFAISYPIAAVDHDVLDDWKSHSLPTTYVLNSAGQIMWSQLGPVTLNGLENALQAVLKEETKPQP